MLKVRVGIFLKQKRNEMDIKELRIGNLLTTIEGTKHYDKVLEVENIIDNNYYNLDDALTNVNGYNLSELLPIPLTEEWLLRLGFNVVGNSDKEDSLHPWLTYEFEGIEITLPYMEFHYNCGDNSVELKHVHSLQNLYFALTGKELECK